MQSNIEYIKGLLATDPNNENLRDLLQQSIVMDLLKKYPIPLLNLEILTDYNYEDLITDEFIDPEEPDTLPKKAYEIFQDYFLGAL